MCTLHQIDVTKTEAFAEKLLGIINGGSLALMIPIGHRTGLFDTMSRLPAATSQQIAEAAGLNERYVREWLGAMTVGGIVDCDPAGPLFSLPPEHAASLTRAAAADNFAVFAQYVGVLGVDGFMGFRLAFSHMLIHLITYFVIRPLIIDKSPLDVEGIDAAISAEETIDIIRETRNR